MEVLIFDKVFASLPTPPFSDDEKKAVAGDVYTHIWQHANSKLFATQRDPLRFLRSHSYPFTYFLNARYPLELQIFFVHPEWVRNFY